MNAKKKNCFLLVVLSILLCLPFSLSLPAEAAYENTHVNTGDQATDLVEVARTQVGYHEGTNNYTKYNVWFGSLNDYGYNYAWCQTFVAWCANQAGIPTSMIPRVSGTVSGMDFFKKNGTWKDAGITPEKGDIIYFHSKSSSGYHVGIVANVSGGQISTIEGNSSDQVAERSYSVGSSTIVGYGCPEYVEPNPNPPSISELSIEKTNYAVGESVNFHFSSDYATKYTLGIDKGSEKRLDTIYDITNTGYSYTFQEPGEYRAYVVSINKYGYKDSNWITFYVYDKSPSISELSIEKTNYAVGESVNFHFSSDYATKYTLGIDKGSEKRLDIIYDITNTGYSYTFQEPGEYRAYVVSINKYGYKDSNWITFYVYDKSPSISELSIEKTNYAVGESVNFHFSSDYATKYTLGIDKGSEKRLDTIYDITNTGYSYTFQEPGEYRAYVVSINKYGYKDSNWITFYVYDKSPSISELSIEKTNYAVGESVNFHFSSDCATKYTLGIDKGSEKRLDTIYDITNTGYSYTFQEPGEYRAYVVSINEYGYKDSNWIVFYVHNKISITDIISLQQSLLRQTTLTADQAQLADYNGDGNINVLDLMLLKRALLAL